MAVSQDVLDRVNAAYREFVSQINASGPNTTYLECQGNQDAIRRFAKAQTPSIPLELFQESFVWTECWMRARAAGLLQEPERPLSDAEKREEHRIWAEKKMREDRRIDLGHRSDEELQRQAEEEDARKRKLVKDTREAIVNAGKEAERRANAEAAKNSFDNVPSIASLQVTPLSSEEEIAFYRKHPPAVIREYARRKQEAVTLNFVAEQRERDAALRAKRSEAGE